MTETARKNILICDDELLNRKLITAMLNGLPYVVSEVSNGTEAIARLLGDYDALDLVLLDIAMKDVSGTEVCRAVRGSEQDQKRHMPIIAYTAHAMNDEHERIISAGFDEILTKPTSRAALLALLEKYTSTP